MHPPVRMMGAEMAGATAGSLCVSSRPSVSRRIRGAQRRARGPELLGPADALELALAGLGRLDLRLGATL
jgi:hypothetical protein